jgi:hypothetical protein
LGLSKACAQVFALVRQKDLDPPKPSQIARAYLGFRWCAPTQTSLIFSLKLSYQGRANLLGI